MVTLGIAEAPASRRHCDHDRPNLWRVALAICSLARLPSHGRNSRAAEADRQDKWRTVACSSVRFWQFCHFLTNLAHETCSLCGTVRKPR